jgi:hypothetical protein
MQSGQTLEMLSDFVRQLAPRLRRKIFRDDRFAERGEMTMQHINLHAAQGVDDRRDLMRDVETVPVGLDHFLQAPDLSFDAPETRQLIAMIGFADFRRRLFFFTIFASCQNSQPPLVIKGCGDRRETSFGSLREVFRRQISSGGFANAAAATCKIAYLLTFLHRGQIIYFKRDDKPARKM